MKKHWLAALLCVLPFASGCWSYTGITKGEGPGEYIILETKTGFLKSSSIISEYKYEIDAEGQPHLVRQYVLHR